MAEYTDVPEMEQRLGEGVDAGRMAKAITAAARVIENVCGGRRGPRSFDLAESATARLYRVRDHILTEPGGQLLIVDDVGSLDDFVAEVGDGSTWEAVTDYRPEPLNALVVGEPYTELRRVDVAAFGLPARWLPTAPVVDPLARITARWGWPGTPGDIPDANRILAQRYYKRKDAPWGVAGFGESGLARLKEEDPDVALMLVPYMRGV